MTWSLRVCAAWGIGLLSQAVLPGIPSDSPLRWGLGAAKAAEAGFVEGFEDLPLMPGLTQEPGATTSFDSPYGRIIESYASGRTTAGHVQHFYNETLPQLGWQPVIHRADALTFQREGEDLSLSITQQNGAVTVRFQSSPH